MQFNSLRSRMTATFACAFAALILLCVGFTLWFARAAAEQNANTVLTVAVNRIKSERFTKEKVYDPSEWQDVKEELALQNLALIVVDTQGRALEKTPGHVPEWPRREVPQWRLRTVPLDGGTAIVGLFWQKTEAVLRVQEATILAFSLLLLASATTGVWLLVGRTLSPIDRLARQADMASIDDMQIRLNTPSEDAEIVHLVGTLNGLLARLSEAMAARGRFYAAASHELRTPLQTLTGYLEMALMHRRSAGEYQEILVEATGQAERLTSLIQALLLLNKVGATSLPRKEPVDLAECCDRWLCNFKVNGNPRGLCVDARLPEGLLREAPISYVDILIRNILENAFKYALPGSVLRVSLQADAEGTLLSVFNECARLPDWDEARLFEPFYRPDASRNSETGGTGLGLAICKAIADASGWTVDLRQVEGGVLVTVMFS